MKTKFTPAVMAVILSIIAWGLFIYQRNKLRAKKRKLVESLLRDEFAREWLRHLINGPESNWGKPQYKGVKGLFYDGKNNQTIAFDNSSGDLWVEGFDTQTKAIAWLNNEIEVSEINRD